MLDGSKTIGYRIFPFPTVSPLGLDPKIVFMVDEVDHTDCLLTVLPSSSLADISNRIQTHPTFRKTYCHHYWHRRAVLIAEVQVQISNPIPTQPTLRKDENQHCCRIDLFFHRCTSIGSPPSFHQLLLIALLVLSSFICSPNSAFRKHENQHTSVSIVAPQLDHLLLFINYF